ncbi:hypothetical protein GCM10010465_14430 [Actinomadura fibrosa]
MALKTGALQAQLQELKEYLPKKELTNPKVSSAAVGWHISHILQVINNIFDSLKNSDPEDFKRDFSFWKTAVFMFRKIPRGKARSPKVVLPPDDIEMEFLQQQMEEAQANILLINNFPKKAHFAHPFFNHLNRNETKKFLEIHTEHHLKIIRDILK